MSTAAVQKQARNVAEVSPDFVIHLGPFSHKFTDQDFEKACQQNPDLRIEMSKEGQLIIMMPAVYDGSNRNFKLTGRFAAWVESNDLGEGFDSSNCFTLPNGAKRGPDAAWIRKERADALTPEQRNTFANICPDFVIELRSKTDRLKPLQNKMSEYIENGAQLGWLIDPSQGKVHIYRPDRPIEILEQPAEISGEDVLPGFVLQLAGILD